MESWTVFSGTRYDQLFWFDYFIILFLAAFDIICDL